MITVNSVLEAYERTGLRARQSELYKEDMGCACGLGVLLYDIHGRNFWNVVGNVDHETDRAAELLGLDHAYVREFAAGFDGTYMARPGTDGYSDGRATWEACKREGLVLGIS